ncbi:chorismate lyase [Halopseudomonas nanhaiensis]|uniref:chorismate--pyruvate lyase family protein n=1 Tax=Halopseudomonas nanhaiensis TaxID=2830842 RepID=UPI001CBB14BA|nr:chorismate lyase [Halopseudomonas nanhaiensis]UAW98337.1 chorismate lyase [Halopseudomonas nanhaiensis]
MTVPHWLPAEHHPAPPADPLYDWLRGQGSLTRRLMAAGGDDFCVELLRQSVQAAREDEALALGIQPGADAWVREVLLHAAGAPRVFARSVAPLASLADSGLDLERLGTRSLGEVLFADARIERSDIEISRYPAHWLPAEHQQVGLWGRRSQFSHASLRLLVCEVFLDGWPPAN